MNMRQFSSSLRNGRASLFFLMATTTLAFETAPAARSLDNFFPAGKLKLKTWSQFWLMPQKVHRGPKLKERTKVHHGPKLKERTSRRAEDYAAEEPQEDVERDCAKGLFTAISFQVTDAQNLPVPEYPSYMYTMLSWANDNYQDTTMVVVDNATGLTGLEPVHRTLPEYVGSTRSVSWMEGTWLSFPAPCGEEKIVFDIFKENSGVLRNEALGEDRGGAAPAAGGDEEAFPFDQHIFSYDTRASVADYYDLVGEAASCWYIERDSEPVVDIYSGQAGALPSQRYVYLKWCVKVTCDPSDSCFQTLSTWAWITILSLFLFPAVLCVCCICCMSNKCNVIFDRCTGGVRRAILGVLHGAGYRHSENANNGNGEPRRGGGAELELQQLAALGVPVVAGGQTTTRGRRAQPRINYIKLTTESTLEDLRSSSSRSRNGGGGGGDNDSSPHAEDGGGGNGGERERVREEVDDDPICAICLSELLPKEKVKMLPCSHIFHAGCVDMWGENSTTCPLCKFECGSRPPLPSPTATTTEAPAAMRGNFFGRGLRFGQGASRSTTPDGPDGPPVAPATPRISLAAARRGNRHAARGGSFEETVEEGGAMTEMDVEVGMGSPTSTSEDDNVENEYAGEENYEEDEHAQSRQPRLRLPSNGGGGDDESHL